MEQERELEQERWQEREQGLELEREQELDQEQEQEQEQEQGQEQELELELEREQHHMTALFNPVRITFQVTPVAKGRPRFTRNGYAYTPEKTRQYETTLKWLWKQSGLAMVPEVPIHLTIGFFLKRPKSVKATRILPTVKPDVDNFQKALVDSLNGLAWKDDSLITDVQAYKRYTTGTERIELVIAPVILGAA